MNVPLLHYKCIPVEQHGKVCHLFSAPAKVLFEILDINERVSDKDEGYQRVLSVARVRQITDFVRQGNVISPAIVVSLKGAEFDAGTGQLAIPRCEHAGWVIDGQHRLVGAAKADKEVELAVIAFLDLDLEEQVFQFVTINRTAKGVPSSLYYDLRKYLPPAKKPSDIAKDKASDIAQQLKLDESSPLYGRITITPPQAGRSISLTNFVRKVAPLIQENKSPISSFTVLEQSRIIDNYFKGLREHEPALFRNSPSIVFRTVGFGALLNALPFFFNLTFTHHGGFRVVDVADVFNRINFDFSKWNEAGSGNAAEIVAGNELVAETQYTYEEQVESGRGTIRLD